MYTKRRVVAALGGNAFVPPGGKLTMAGQFRFAHEAMTALLPLLGSDVELVLGHGNGPQVGTMLTRVEQTLGEAYDIPLEVCVAETEGELGYVLQQSMHNVLVERGMTRPVVTLVTQVVVDAADPAFALPTKPIGPFYDGERAEELRKAGFVVREEAHRGFRRVVPSPEPREVIEADVIGRLLEIGVVVIAAGGGGVPVIRAPDGRLIGIDAVIDKDLSAALIADAIGASDLVILTGVPFASTAWGTSDERPIGRVTPAEIRTLASKGHFPPGSMGPKVEAAARFAAGHRGRRAIITDPTNLPRALDERGGTIVTDAA